MATTTTATLRRYNVHRWYSPSIGRYSRPDPLGLNDEDYNLYGYAVENPLRFIDPLGQVALAPGEGCRGFPRVRRKLQQLKDNCECVRFFREELGADLVELIDGPLPVIRLKEGTPGGRTPCEEDPGAIWVDPKFCRLGNRGKLPRIILHELGHYADCAKQRFPRGGPTEEGAEAERACFGESIDAKVVR